MEYRLAEVEPGKVKAVKELTPAKRYSFLVGVNEPNHTCRRQFLELVQQEDINPTLEEIENAFSIEKVTKEFFIDYKELYLRLEESLKKVIEQDSYVKQEFKEKNISTIDFAKKLLGQIVFIYFLQKKGWLGVGVNKEWGSGPKDFMRRLFGDKKKGIKPMESYKNFFNDILEPLFYEALANPREADDGYYSRFNCKIPFLNGGLFEPINDYDWAGTEIVLSNSVFEEILTTFDQYNFTVKEDEPLEKEVAIDPEMLGKVFENLLDIKDRKSTGRYYTPREIVHYMCQQSLINYLATNSSIPRRDIEKFIQLGDFALDLTIRAQEQKKRHHGKTFDIDESLAIPKPIEDNYKEIDRLLKDIKIVDPAVGSGAFPIGMTNEIVKARSILTIFFDEYEQKKRSVYNFKREAIENSLYGVDIDSSAVDIAKLRFWLSLIVDEQDIKNIKPLPNLDHKIMCGNSLLEEFEGVKLFDEKLLIEIPKDYSYQLEQIDREVNKLNQELHDIHTGKKADNGTRTRQIQRELKNLKREKEQILAGPEEDISQVTLDEALQKRVKESQKKLKELKDLQKKFFDEQNRKLKKQYREEIDRIEWELIEETLKEQGNEDAMQKLAQYKKNKSKPFFLWKLYFAEVFQRDNPGFDVVIANPPYIQLQKFSGQDIQEAYQNSGYETFNKTADIYCLFYEKGILLLRNKGALCYITSNKWMRAGYGKQLREFFCSKDPSILLDFGGLRIFETAAVDTNVLLVQNSENQNNLKALTIKKDFNIGNLIEKYFTDNFVVLDSLTSKPWFIGNPTEKKIKKKIEELGTPLKRWNIKIRRGVLTGCNQAFIINEKKRAELISADKKNKEIIKPIVRGRDIRRYKIHFAGLYLIVTGYDINVQNLYPVIYNYLKEVGEKIKNGIIEVRGKGLFERDDQGENWWNLRACDYYSEFEKEKIIYPETTQKASFYYDQKGEFFVEKTGFILTGDNLKYLTVLLNSKFVSYIFKKYYTGVELGDKGYQYNKHALEELPIPFVDSRTEHVANHIILLFDKIHSVTKDNDYLDNPDKQAKVKNLEEQIDELVYELYELKPEEIEIVEGFNKEK